jgi:hypothetical protein
LPDAGKPPRIDEADAENAAPGGDEEPATGPGVERGADLRPPGGGGPPDNEVPEVHRSYWSEVPRFLRDWGNHVDKWPAERVAAAVDRSRDPAGSWRGDGNQYLDPDQHAQTNDLIAEVAKAEKSLTRHMREIEHDNAHGGWLEGLEHRRKGEERLKEKIAEKVEHEPGKSLPKALRQVADAIRYTFCFEPDKYSDGYADVKELLEARDYQLIFSRNNWPDNPEYKGINTRWATPDGQRFEVQFHTRESHDAKEEVTHFSYERLRNPLTPANERPELHSYQREVCSWIAEPKGVTAIADYRRKGRD